MYVHTVQHVVPYEFHCSNSELCVAISLPFQDEKRAKPKQTDGGAAATDHTDSTPTVNTWLTFDIVA